VLDQSGSGQCPPIQEALKVTAQARTERRLRIQAKVYHPGLDKVTVPTALANPNPDSKQAGAGSVTNATSGKRGGTTSVSVTVGIDGSVTNVKVLRSSAAEIDEKAVETVKSWKFDPARKDGLPVPVDIVVEMNFHLY
jgi:periplasmic protein TonB